MAKLPDFVNDLLGNTTMTISEYLDEIKTHLGLSTFNELCAGLRETYFRPGTEYSLAEWHLYGSSRLGIYQANKQMATYYDSTLTTISYSTRIQYRTNGNRRFELSNHLGNVLVTVSDKRTAVCTVSETVAYYKAEVITASDYYSFGSVMQGRSYMADTVGYRFSYTGKENINDVYGDGNAIDYGTRILDTRLGRWGNTEPLEKKYPMHSPYSYCVNNPILFIDVDGNDWFVNVKDGRVIYIKNATQLTTEVAEKNKLIGLNPTHYERLGPNDMFGDKVSKAELKRQVIVIDGCTECTMSDWGYEKAEKVTIQEMEFTSGGAMGNHERIEPTTTTIKQIGGSKITYAKPTDLNKKEVIDKKKDIGPYSTIKSITYKLTKPHGQDNRKTAEYLGNRTRSNEVNLGLKVLKEVIDIIVEAVF